MKDNPYTSSPVLKDLLFYYEPKPLETYGGRDKEIQKMLRIINKRQYIRNCLVYGDFGVGKSSLIDKFVSYTSSKNMDFVFFDLDVNKLLSKSPKELNDIFAELKKLLTKKAENILIVDDIKPVLDNASTKKGIIELLRNPAIRVIATLETLDYRLPEPESFWYNLFEKVPLDSFDVYDVYNMIKHQIDDLARSHNVRISKEIANWIIHASICFKVEENEPLRSLSVLDSVMTSANLNGHSTVRKSDFFDFFVLETKTFNGMSYKQKLRTAIHEIGHLVIYLMTPDLADYLPVATSCIPTIRYVGRTFMDASAETLSLRDSEGFYIHLVSALLGGRIAEEIFNLPNNAGASEDLKKANKMAVDMSTLYGMNQSAGDRIMIVGNLESIGDISEEILSESELDENLVSLAEVYAEEILSKARNYAEEIIKHNKDLILTAAEKLAKEGILTKPDFDKLF